MDIDRSELKSTRQSALPKTTGQAQYPSDLTAPGCLYGHVVRTAIPHGLVRSIDVSEARKVPGVHAVVVAQDIPGSNRLGKTVFDQPILADEKISSYIDAVALIAAEDKDTALLAEKKIRMEIEPLPGIFSIQDARAPEAPLIHPESPGNILTEIHLSKGSIVRGFQDAEWILEDTYQTPAIEHCYFEPDNGLIVPQPGRKFTIWVGCHSVHTEQQIAAQTLNIPLDHVTVIQPYTGGSFGGKDDGLLTAYLALLGHFSGRPVRISFDRKQLFISHTKRHPQWITIRMGFRRDGTITAAHYCIQSDTGSYAHWAEGIFSFASIGVSGPYRIPNIQVDTTVVYTNNIPMGAMRGWGMPAVNFANECHLDKAARALSLHPLELRMKNAAIEGDLMVTGASFPPGIHIRDTIRAAANHVGVLLQD